ncbi:MAG: transglycosylase protein [Pseudomonadota bacterium]|jgi:soluble lytic murein transglycosylase-like protein
MKKAVIRKKSAILLSTLNAIAKCAGVASYVTLVFLLTQKNLVDRSAQQAAAALQSQARLEEMKGSRRAQQAGFVSEIIRLHNPSKQNTQNLAEIIVSESEKAGYDPLFVAAIIRSESMFRHAATSSRGAKGLMQLMPATGKYISEREKIALKDSHDLHDPATNIRLGIAYLKYLERKFNGNRERVLIAYNWGPSKVVLSLRSGAKPPTQSLQYAKTILSAHSQWESEFTRHASAIDVTTRSSMLG